MKRKNFPVNADPFTPPSPQQKTAHVSNKMPFHSGLPLQSPSRAGNGVFSETPSVRQSQRQCWVLSCLIRSWDSWGKETRCQWGGDQVISLEHGTREAWEGWIKRTTVAMAVVAGLCPSLQSPVSEVLRGGWFGGHDSYVIMTSSYIMDFISFHHHGSRFY